MAVTTSAVPGGPSTWSGWVTGLITQWVVTTSFRSQMWSLWRWVSSTAESCMGSTPAAASRSTTPRPASTSRVRDPACTRVAAPARSGDGSGLPVPRSVTFTSSGAHGSRPASTAAANRAGSSTIG